MNAVKAFRGTFYYELQIGPLVFQVGRRWSQRHVLPFFAGVWRDPMWRS